MSINIVQGSILDFKGDVIVNPANGHLRHGGGLAAVIDRAAQGTHQGALAVHLRDAVKRHEREAATSLLDFPDSPDRPGFLRSLAEKAGKVAQYVEDHDNAPLVATGNAHATSAGVLPYKAIIHAVGPIWNGGKFYERELLNLAHISAGHVADGLGAQSIAFPAISAGIFGFPIDQAAYIAISAAEAITFVGGLDVTFYLFEDDHYAAYSKALKESW